MSKFTRRERTLAIAAIVLAGSAAALSAVGLAGPAALAAGGAAFSAGIDFLWRRATRPAPERAHIEKFVSQQGRKFPIYERETGLFTHWYLELRGKEECDRAARYQRELAFLVIEPSREDGDQLNTLRTLQVWLTKHLRHTDIAGYLGNGRFLIIMPEADGEAATQLIRRLKTEGYATDVGLSCYPFDGKTYDDLYKAASAQLPITLRLVA
jgi:hypothetical protein